MFLFSIDLKQSHRGPLWLMQMWAYSYFPSITPELHPTKEPWSYGKVWMHTRYPGEVLSFPTFFKLFSNPSRKRLPEYFMPFRAKRYGSEDFKGILNQGFFRCNATWGACLQSRELVVMKASSVAMEAYCPSLVARKFGLVQLLLVPPTWTKNTNWSERVSISKDEAQ